MRVLGVNAVFHDPAAALVVDGEIVAAAEEERFSRRKHGKVPVPFSTWELPEGAMAYCLREGGLEPGDLDAIAYSYDPALAMAPSDGDVVAGEWEALRTLYVERAPRFLQTALPGLDPSKVRHVAHHVAHAASAYLCAGMDPCSVLVNDGRGERGSHLAGSVRDGRLEILAAQELPHSLGLLYEELTAHLGFRRSSDEYKVMAMASYGSPRWLGRLRELVVARPDGGFGVGDVDFSRWAPALTDGEQWTPDHADLAASVQQRLEEVLLDLVRWLHERTGGRTLTLAGGVALPCVANTRVLDTAQYAAIWVQRPAGASAPALGGALHVARAEGDIT